MNTRFVFNLQRTLMISMMRAALVIGITSIWSHQNAQAQLVEVANKGAAEGGDFPSDWYVRDGEGLEELRNLEGKPAQEISIAQWKGDATTMAQLKGKIVVLDFWATWCGPCMAVIPKNVEFIGKYKDKGVALIGIHDAQSGWDSVDKVISEKGINYPVALDNTQESSGATTKAYAIKFWPTYFVIDRNGILRGAAIKPDKIEEAVQQLLNESPTPSANLAAKKATSIPDTWFLGGEKRLKSMRSHEGKKAPILNVSNWLGNEPDREGWDKQVRVVQFVRPELSASVDQLSKLQAVSERFAKQGVVFIAVCDARSSVDRMKSVIEDKRIEVPVAADSPVLDGALAIGATANSMGIRFAPNTIVIDRAGVLRATGLKPDFLDNVLNQLLAEATPIEAGLDNEIRAPDAHIAPKALRENTTRSMAFTPDAGQPPAPKAKP